MLCIAGWTNTISLTKNRDMKLRKQFTIWGILLYTTVFITLILLYEYNKWVFLTGEILLFVSLILFVSIYKKLVRPVDAIGSALSLLRERNFNTRLVPVGQSDIDNLIEVYNKMTEQLRIERIKQRESNYLLDKLIDVGPSGIIIFDFDNKIVKLNRKAVTFIGSTSENECLGKTLDSFNNKISNSLYELNDEESKIITTEGARRYKIYRSGFMDNGFQRPFITIEELTSELINAERKSYEKVIRMMSHEVNNSVCAVNSIVDSAINFNRDINNPMVDDICSALEISKERNNNLARFMKNFANIVKIPTPTITEVNIKYLVTKTSNLMVPLANEHNINITTNLPEHNLYIKADTTQLEQVIINSIKNSIEAIEADGDIDITLTDKGITISDNGCGINDNIKSKLFTPFFSTKTNGQGVGLTLIREILSNHHMDFSLSTDEDHITKFVIHFNNSNR